MAALSEADGAAVHSIIDVYVKTLLAADSTAHSNVRAQNVVARLWKPTNGRPTAAGRTPGCGTRTRLYRQRSRSSLGGASTFGTSLRGGWSAVPTGPSTLLPNPGNSPRGPPGPIRALPATPPCFIVQSTWMPRTSGKGQLAVKKPLERSNGMLIRAFGRSADRLPVCVLAGRHCG